MLYEWAEMKKYNITIRAKGALLLLGAQISFQLMNVLARCAGDGVSPIFKTFFRNIVTAAVIIVPFIKGGKRFILKKQSIFWHLLRSLAGTLGVICNFYAFDHMLFSDATAIITMSPFFTIVFSAILIKEKTTLKQWISVLMAFCGMVLIVRPSVEGVVSTPALSALAVAVFTGIAYTSVRKLGIIGEDPAVTVLLFSLFSSIVCMPNAFIHKPIFQEMQFLFLISAAICACVGQILITNAYKFAKASEISILDYSSIIFSNILGWILFGEKAQPQSFIGYGIILIAGRYMFLIKNRSIVK